MDLYADLYEWIYDVDRLYVALTCILALAFLAVYLSWDSLTQKGKPSSVIVDVPLTRQEKKKLCKERKASPEWQQEQYAREAAIISQAIRDGIDDAVFDRKLSGRRANYWKAKLNTDTGLPISLPVMREVAAKLSPKRAEYLKRMIRNRVNGRAIVH